MDVDVMPPMTREQVLEALGKGLWFECINTGWRNEYPCMICKRMTTLIEVNFEGPLCSDQCANAMWEQYFEALRRRSDAEGESTWTDDVGWI